MKQIGHIDDAALATTWKTHALGMLVATPLFIPNPGERENIDADKWQLVGWTDPDKDGGQIWPTHAEAGPFGRPAYVRVLDPERQEVCDDGTVRLLPKRLPHDAFANAPKYGETGGIVGANVDPVDVRRSEYDTLVQDVAMLVKRLMQMEIGTDGYLPGEDQENDLTKSIATMGMKRSLGVIFARLDMHSTRLEKLERMSPPVASEPPMTFYDHAFIACAVAGIKEGNGLTQAIQDAHKLAGHLTRNRANQP